MQHGRRFGVRRAISSLLLASLVSIPVYAEEKPPGGAQGYAIVGTGVAEFYDNASVFSMPGKGEAFFGQDAHYRFNEPSCTDNDDGTVTDNVTGLMWQKVMAQKMSFDEAAKRIDGFKLAGHADWRIPSVKELYSLMNFTGQVRGQTAIRLFIDTGCYSQPLGRPHAGERQIDAQTWSSTVYVGKTMRNDETVFGVNFVDGRIKGYPKYHPRTGEPNRMYFRFVRGNSDYGKNRFVDNADGTITDIATGLMWQQADSKDGMIWEHALAYAEGLELAGHDDWRLPDAKELQSLVDYTRSLQTTGSAAIDPLFETTEVEDPEGGSQYPYFWTSTTHLDGRNPYSSAVYIAFGEAQGKMRGRLMDVHGAGSQRSDPKTGSRQDYPRYFGPQGDARYVYNYVRSVRSAGR